MANIAEYLRKILSARLGEEVRGSIHDSIKAMNEHIENDLGGMIEEGNEVINNMNEEIDSVEAMKLNGELNLKPEDLSEEQWDDLKLDLTNYYKRYESVYVTTESNETRIPINIRAYNTLAIIEVYIEGRILNRNEYSIYGTSYIILETPLSELGTEVQIVVYRSVCASTEDLDELKGYSPILIPSRTARGAKILIKDEEGDKEVELYDVESCIEIITPRNYEITDYSSGDYTLLRYDGKILMIDTHSSTIWTGLLEDLQNYNIEKIDCLIISHYHTDHIGNLENLINNGYIDENTIVYLPNYTSNWDTYVGTEHSNVINLLTTNNIPYEIITTENTEKTFANNVNIKFNNVNIDYYLTHPNGNGSVDYNDCSMMTSIYYHNISMFFGGDAGKTAIEHMMDLGYIKHKYNLWKICHHGNNNSANTFNEKYANIINPDFAIQYSCMKAQSENFYAENETKYFHKFNTKMYSTSRNKENIILSISRNSINCVQGIENSHTNNILQVLDVYVDSTYTGFIQDGTQEHPFKDIPQCITSLYEKAHTYYNIHIKNGEYCKNNYPASSIRDKIQINKSNSIINLIGESKAGVKIYKNIDIRNSSVSIRNATFNVIMNLVPFEAYFSKVSVRDVDFINATENVLNSTFIANSDVDFINCSFTKFNNCIRANRSRIIANNITSIDNSTIINLDTSTIQATNLILNNSNEFTGTTNGFNLTNSKIIGGYTLMEYDSTGVTNIDLQFPKTNFEYLEIYYMAGNFVSSTKVPSNLASTLLSALLINAANTAGYLYNALCTMDTQNLTLSRNRQVGLNPSPGISFSEQNAIKIVKIKGY